MTAAANRTFGLCAAVVLAAVAWTQDAEPKPVANVTQIMQVMVVPPSNALFNVARQAPETDEEWRKLREGAILLAESGNLLLMPGRAEDTDVWRDTSLEMVEAGADALRAADAKDVDGLIEAGNRVIDACEVCHELHWQR